jgi:hypothetical protein
MSSFLNSDHFFCAPLYQPFSSVGFFGHQGMDTAAGCFLLKFSKTGPSPPSWWKTKFVHVCPERPSWGFSRGSRSRPRSMCFQGCGCGCGVARCSSRVSSSTVFSSPTSSLPASLLAGSKSVGSYSRFIIMAASPFQITVICNTDSLYEGSKKVKAQQ